MLKRERERERERPRMRGRGTLINPFERVILYSFSLRTLREREANIKEEEEEDMNGRQSLTTRKQEEGTKGEGPHRRRDRTMHLPNSNTSMVSKRRGEKIARPRKLLAETGRNLLSFVRQRRNILHNKVPLRETREREREVKSKSGESRG